MFIPVVTFNDVQCWVCVDAPNERMFVFLAGRVGKEQKWMPALFQRSLVTGDEESISYYEDGSLEAMIQGVQNTMKERYPDVDIEFWEEDRYGPECWL